MMIPWWQVIVAVVISGWVGALLMWQHCARRAERLEWAVFEELLQKTPETHLILRDAYFIWMGWHGAGK